MTERDRPQIGYLCHPLSGEREKNVRRALAWLKWAHKYTRWGLRVQCPWLASAMVEVERGTTEEQWRASGGIEIERRVLTGYDFVLHCGPRISTGMIREARAMLSQGGVVYSVAFHGLVLPPERPLRIAGPRVLTA